MSIFVDSAMSDDARGKELYAGSIFFHKPCKGAMKLCEFARELTEEAFKPLDPSKIEAETLYKTPEPVQASANQGAN